ncbi:MAG TPA: hypothetical protein VFS27_00735 [Blastocatellia bacterium]|jgi:hypothetical protein|nr:hypothetical protein [Blastocatellia bacterium]
MKPRRRTEKREARRQQKADAKALRAAHGLCQCQDDERFYATNEEADADTTPAKVCEKCGKTMLKVQVIAKYPEDVDAEQRELAPAMIHGILR